MRHTDRHDGRGARLELEPLLASPNREPSLEHDVALILGMAVQRGRRVSRKQELDQGIAPLGRFPRNLDRRQGAQEPEPFALRRT